MGQVEFFDYFWGMNENEYMDYYCQNLLWQVQLDDNKTYYDNDISTLNYDAVLHNAEEFGITKELFLSAVKFYADKCKQHINIDALWKLSALIWHWKALHIVAIPEIRDVDLYVKLASLLQASRYVSLSSTPPAIACQTSLSFLLKIEYI